MQAVNRNEIVENLGSHTCNFYWTVITFIIINTIAVRGLTSGTEGVKQHPHPAHF